MRELPGYERRAPAPRHNLPMNLIALRHTLATLSYRAAKVLCDAPPGFAGFQAGPTSRTPAAILAHMGDLFDWALSMARGAERWHDAAPLVWEAEVKRFNAALQAFDEYLAANELSPAVVERLFQGPVADALTHLGQIAFLRRLAGGPVRGENYSRAPIETGRIGVDQPPPVGEFG